MKRERERESYFGKEISGRLEKGRKKEALEMERKREVIELGRKKEIKKEIEKERKNA